MLIPGYEIIEELSGNGRHRLCRGRRRSDGKAVLLKVVRRAPAEVAMLRREQLLLGEISIAGLVRADDLIEDEQWCSLVLEDRGGTPLARLLLNHHAARRPDLDLFFKLALPLSTILAELHRREIIHRHITPESILYDEATGEVTLADLHLASRSAAEATLPSHLAHQPLVYISPEQTGRMNRAVDYRTDFYSLGVVCYEMLTGRPPFDFTDQLELIHSHIARTPAAPSEIESRIPAQLSAIILKLLAKTPEERYQSASGLREDLERCAREWRASGTIEPFPLAERDVSDRFLISQNLYGRDQEVAELILAFERVCQGGARSAMMLVAGYSGIGKTSLIQTLYRPIVRHRGYFISGKFDPVGRNIPFDGLIQAFRALAEQMLTENEERLSQWRAKLSAALGANGGVLTEVVPEMELVIGRQPPPPALDAAEALNRFQLCFQNFVAAIAGPEHPLVIFLDDLQWADSATLSLLEPLLTGEQTSHLFLIGAYRDNEVDENHPLARAIEAVEAAGVPTNRIALGPLELQDLARLLLDTLHSERETVEPLARLMLDKTGGNPLFAIQFLKTLEEEGYLAFDYDAGRWTYEIEAIESAPLTDNIIDLVTRKIERLSPAARRALTLAACIGSPFDLSTLAIISQLTPDAAAADLQEAIDEGLIHPARREYGEAGATDGEDAAETASYSFLHDRVQQAAYALIPPESKEMIHLTAGRLLLEHALAERREEKLFEICHHLNLGERLMAEDAERTELARLNLDAGRRAKASTAYEAALDYLSAGLSLLDEKPWGGDYELSFALHLEAAECRYLVGDFERAEEGFALLLERARTAVDKARVYGLRIVQYENMSRYREALDCARAGLSLFNVCLPDSEAEKQGSLEGEISGIESLIEGREIAALADLPVMTDPETRIVMSILTAAWPSAYISGDQQLARLISAMMVRLSLIHGNTEESAYGYVTHAITLGPVREDYAAAYEFGRLALRINERFGDTKRRAKIQQQFQAHVNFWRKPLETCIDYAREARRSGLETGDLTYASYGAFTESWAALLTSTDLASFIRDYTPNLALIRRLRVSAFADAQQLLLNWARALGGETESRISLSSEGFSESDYLEAYRDNPFFMIFHSVAKLHLGYLFGRYDEALEAAQRARRMAHHLTGTIWPVLLDFWSGLLFAALAQKAGEEERRRYQAELERIEGTFATLAENCQENFRCQWLLIKAKCERLAGRSFAALDLFEQSIRYAEATKNLAAEALSYELCARTWLGRGQSKIAAALLAEARTCYGEWGAAAKVAHLEEEYAGLRPGARLIAGGENRATEDRAAEDRAAAREAGEAGALDLFSVMKAVQAIAGEIELERLLAKLLRIALENAGAERGSLILEREGELFVYAAGALDREEVDVHAPLTVKNADSLPRSVIHYARRTAGNVVLFDAVNDDRHGSDPYIAREKPRSIMTIPVLNHGRLLGLLYLEHRIASGVFTPDRIQITQILAAQAAISLENALLYDETLKAEQTLRSIVEGTAAVTGGDFFSSLVQHLAAALGCSYAFVTECRGGSQMARTLAFWNKDRLAENVEYKITETPCRRVLEGEVCFYPQGLQEHFPADRGLADLKAVGYLGIPLRSGKGEVIGHLAVIDDKPMERTPRGWSLIKIFAARAGAELERQHADQELRVALAEVGRLKNRLEAENVYLQEEIRREHNFEEIVGSSPALMEVLRRVEVVAPTDSTVLINGETGTGKELIARAIHNLSARKDRPLVKVNCGAISAGLVESELFGHVKGAFTGAFERRTGRFELADGGTLFLDEVGELQLETQVKLLRVLQEGEFEPVGSSRTVRVDVRIIAATNRNLEEAVEAGRFRADLFYRLNVLPLRMPALRERSSDIAQLVMFFIARFAKKFGKRIEGVSQETMALLSDYPWPGNVRELENVIERAVVLSESPILALSSKLFPASGEIGHRADEIASSSAAAPSVEPSALTLEEIERRHILSVLKQTGWIIEGPKGAARILNLHPNTMRGRMKKLGIRRPA